MRKMATRIIKFKRSFKDEDFDEFLKQYQEVSLSLDVDNNEVLYDLSLTEFVSSLGMLLLNYTSDCLKEKGCRCMVRFLGQKKVKLFTKIMGLIQPRTKDEEDFIKLFSSLLVPLVPIEKCHNSDECFAAVNKIAALIMGTHIVSENILRAILWALGEITVNAGLHGYESYTNPKGNYSKPVYCCAVNVISKYVDIAILDGGQGILNSLKSSGNPRYQHISNQEALKLCIQKDVTGDPNGSAGFGLFGCAEIVRGANGRMRIFSGSDMLIIKKDGIKEQSIENYSGTMISIEIPINSHIDLEKIFGKDSIMEADPLYNLIFGYYE